jgi:arylsulfatase A
MDDTLFVFTSDNGAHQVDRPRPHREVLPPYTFVLDAVWDAQQKGLKPNGDLRGSKGGIHEGGFRVPFVARWPSHIPANSVSGRTICLVDVIATIADLLGVSPPNHDGDSHSFLPHLLGKPVDDSGRDALVLHSGNGTFAVRKGPWKWIEGVPANARRRVTNQAAQELYNLVEDPAETRNVVSQRSEIAREMATILKQIRDQ